MWPGGTSANSASRSAGFHHEVSTNRFGCSGSTRHSQARSEIAQWARMIRRPGNSPDERTVSSPERGDAAPGVDEHRHPALVGERHHVAHPGLGERELLGARVELDALRAGVEAAASPRAQRVGARVERQNGDDAPPESRAAGEHASLASRVAAGLVHGERHRRVPPARSSASSSSSGDCLKPSGSFAPDVGVGVVEREVTGVGDQAVPPRTDQCVDVDHRTRRL